MYICKQFVQFVLCVCTSGESSESDLPDSDSVFEINSGADFGIGIDMGIAIYSGNGMKIDYSNGISYGMRISS